MADEGGIEKRRYDVFLCFRGEDTRYTFTGNLYAALRQARLRTFFDDGFKSGDQIFDVVLQAIQESRISIVVLSENFASSSWCLEELVKILECRETKKQLVIPIFYRMDPSDVRRQTGCYGESLAQHQYEFRSDSEKVRNWQEALTHVANLPGWRFSRYQYEYEFIEDIVRQAIVAIVPRYSIFLSFSGNDTRSFTGFLNNALCRSRYQTFMNDGDQISQSTNGVIEESRLSIIVFSENYARSSSCLDFLLTILECMKTKNQLVCPIFYKVLPSDLRHQRNSYGEAMTEHENMLGKDSEMVKKWRSALFDVANLKGFYLKTGYNT